jgi:hypothetical protein
MVSAAMSANDKTRKTAPRTAAPRVARSKATPAPAPVAPAPAPAHDAIARRAFELFVERGYTHGHAMEDWLRAESELSRGQ